MSSRNWILRKEERQYRLAAVSLLTLLVGFACNRQEGAPETPREVATVASPGTTSKTPSWLSAKPNGALFDLGVTPEEVQAIHLTVYSGEQRIVHTQSSDRVAIAAFLSALDSADELAIRSSCPVEVKAVIEKTDGREITLSIPPCSDATYCTFSHKGRTYRTPRAPFVAALEQLGCPIENIHERIRRISGMSGQRTKDTHTPPKALLNGSAGVRQQLQTQPYQVLGTADGRKFTPIPRETRRTPQSKSSSVFICVHLWFPARAPEKI